MTALKESSCLNFIFNVHFSIRAEKVPQSYSGCIGTNHHFCGPKHCTPHEIIDNKP